MKIQDIAFVAVFVFLLINRRPKFLVIAALLCLALAIPLFQFWVFFTAQKLIEYAFFLLLAALLLSFKKS